MNTTRKTIDQRLKIYMDLTGWSRKDIMRCINQMNAEIKDTRITKTDLSDYMRQKRFPTQKKLSFLAKALDVNEAWLMGYDVPMKSSNFKSSDFPAKFNSQNIHVAKNYLKFFDSQTAAYFTGSFDFDVLSDEEILKFANEFRRVERLIDNNAKK